MLFDAAPARTAALRARLEERGVRFERFAIGPAPSSPRRDDVALVVWPTPPEPSLEAALDGLLEDLADRKIDGLLWGVPASRLPPLADRLDCVGADASLDEVLGRLGALSRYGPLVRHMENELSRLELLGERFNRYLSEIDQEMRLAGRLQREFLPTAPPAVGPFRIHTLYRPATFVSGDTYDIFSIDPHRVGIFLADAMGHGVAAGLITISLQQTLMNCRHDDASLVLTPAQTLDRLHECLMRQRLPSCQFVTAAYAVLDAEQCVITLSRGGHPLPLHVRANGEIHPIVSEGGLLGIPDVPPECDSTTVAMAPGDKVVLYTDGLEDVVIQECGREETDLRFTEQFRTWVRMPAAEFVERLAGHLDNREGSLHPEDDVTLLAIERTAAVG